MKKILFILLLWFTALPVLAQNTILIMGNSISAAYGIDFDKGWSMLLQQRLSDEGYDYRIINASISGDITSNALLRLPLALRQYAPQITIIELGGNDGLRGLAISAITSNLTAMARLVQGNNSKVLVLGVRLPPNSSSDYPRQFSQVFSTLAKRQDISVITNVLKNIDDHKDLMQEDGVHPNENAQPIILDNLWPDLKKLLIK